MTNFKNSELRRELISFADLEREFGDGSEGEFARRIDPDAQPGYICLNSMALNLAVENSVVA